MDLKWGRHLAPFQQRHNVLKTFTKRHEDVETFRGRLF